MNREGFPFFFILQYQVFPSVTARNLKIGLCRITPLKKNVEYTHTHLYIYIYIYIYITCVQELSFFP
jgi:hypothetical protein